jgi:threonine dehydrogenase-like Zn-dependent dehydrogenase
MLTCITVQTIPEISAMLQAKIQDTRKIIYEQVAKPTLHPHQAILRVPAVGICGSDMHVYLGENPGIKPPHVAGHEFGGIILSLDGADTGFAVGEKVVVNPVVNCGACYYCKGHMEHMCSNQYVIGGQRDGAMAEEIAVPIANLIKLPDSFDMKYSPMIEPVSVVVHCLKGLTGLNVVVIGTGTIGLLALQLLKMNGNTVIAVDKNDFSLQMSKKLGSDVSLNSTDPELVRTIESSVFPGKIDLVVETVCSRGTLHFATTVVKKMGKVIVIGIPEKNFEVDILNILFNEITVVGSSLYLNSDFEEAKRLVVEEKINVKDLVTKTFPLDKSMDGFNFKLNSPAIKVILTND